MRREKYKFVKKTPNRPKVKTVPYDAITGVSEVPRIPKDASVVNNVINKV